MKTLLVMFLGFVALVAVLDRNDTVEYWLTARDVFHKKNECKLTSEDEVMQRYDCKDGMQLIYTKATK